MIRERTGAIFGLVSAVAAVVVSIFLVLVLQLPASLWSGLGGASSFFTPLAGSTLAEGTGISRGGSASKIIQWHWCPGRGLAALCFSVAGNGAYISGLLTPGFAGIDIAELKFSGLKTTEFGLTDSALRATLSGNIDKALLPWGACFYKGLATVEGELELTDVEIMETAGANLQLRIRGDGERGLRLSSNEVNGDFVLEGNVLRGALKVASSGILVPAKLMSLADSQGVLTMDIAQRFACQ